MTSNARNFDNTQVFDGVDIGFAAAQSSANYRVKSGWVGSLDLLEPLSVPTEPEIDLQGNGAPILNEDIIPSVADGTDFGAITVDWATAPRTFAILNSGDLPLSIAAIVRGTSVPY